MGWAVVAAAVVDAAGAMGREGAGRGITSASPGMMLAMSTGATTGETALAGAVV
jgi:hypothetical protein